MTAQIQARTSPTHLLPLLRSIGREIVERAEALAELEERVRTFSKKVHQAEIAREIASIAEHKRSLRYAHEELEQLGCSIAELNPLTFRIGTDEDADLLWTLGAESLSPTLP